MKLPNFFDFEPLNAIKEKMGIPRHVYGSLSITIEPSRLTEIELVKLTSSQGLDISVNELTVLTDGTLAYKNNRVILYIRDYSKYEPRFHLADCMTLQEMKARKRFDRYVISTNTSGYFDVNHIINNQVTPETKRLPVCQNCLALLALDGFSAHWSSANKKKYVSDFSIAIFFKFYPKDLDKPLPKYNTDNAPINMYSHDFSQISYKYRNSIGWRCQKCNLNLNSESFRKWLHVHHINGIKNDNSRENLRALCIVCHADEPMHEHMKNSLDYIECKKVFNQSKAF